ncbi:efflux RND transporter periplasmic adaptor subunit [Marinimicrobium sp. ARAG 43.8]|uniref:efflux RND transporter periplasmic adaptor subunit n=1 Tax=Marinimicrobium sp. ARAG 43.8 TaxID=3418719 RepID=UPI003CF0CFE8
MRALEAEQRGQTAARDAAAAELRRLEAELERHQLTAPYDGVVSSRQIDIGEWVTPGDPLLELVASESLRIHFQVPQRYFPQIAESAEVALRFDAYPNDAYVGQIHRKVPLSEPGSRTFLLRVNPPKESPLLIPGMATSGELRLDTERTGLAVPRDALIRYPDGRITVWVAQSGSEGAESNVTEQRITTGMSADGWVEIRSGLSDGDVVITRGNEALREGQTVMVQRVSARESRDGAG